MTYERKIPCLIFRVLQNVETQFFRIRIYLLIKIQLNGRYDHLEPLEKN